VSIYVKEPEGFLEHASRVLERSRSAGMKVIHVQVGFRPKLPEVGARNPLFSAIKNSAQHQKLFQGALGAIHPALAPQDDDIVITKHRVDAFNGTDLEIILRANDIDTLILFGIATSGVVLSTLLHAADADYRVVVIQDCCADLDPELHACLVEKVFPRQSSVLSSAEYLEALAA
jgi:nicotinamidase-related amidase